MTCYYQFDKILMLNNRMDPELDPLQIITDPEDQGRPKVADPED
jgi:hypothetical protein